MSHYPKSKLPSRLEKVGKYKNECFIGTFIQLLFIFIHIGRAKIRYCGNKSLHHLESRILYKEK